jgi:FSR family fosmidomycin resistance protein-like MFS transporter
MLVSITTYLPTFLSFEGVSLRMAGISLSVLEAAGVVGALSSGTLSDRLGRKPVLYFAFTASSILLFTFLQVEGWLVFLVLVVLGFASLSPQPVLLAIVQDQSPNNRAAANGMYMSMAFLVRSLVLVLVGVLGDSIGLRSTFLISAGVSLLAIPAIAALPKEEKQLPA